MKRYRVTNADLYASPKCPGFADPSARQGMYCEAEDPKQAREIIRKRCGYSPFTQLDVQDWSGGS